MHHRTVESVLNRYYDPSTDSFISVDPMVQETDQPYVFVNDDPLNADDPLGLQLLLANGKTANVTSATSKSGTKTTVITTPGTKSSSVVISSAPVTVPLGMGFTATISASATITTPNSQSVPTLNVASDGSIGVTANGVTGGVSGSGGNVMTSLSAGIASSPSQTTSVGGDRVTANVSVSLSYDGTSGSSGGALRDTAISAGGGLMIWWWLAKPVCAPAGPIGLLVC